VAQWRVAHYEDAPSVAASVGGAVVVRVGLPERRHELVNEHQARVRRPYGGKLGAGSPGETTLTMLGFVLEQLPKF
jgi:hypothetical protein